MPLRRLMVVVTKRAGRAPAPFKSLALAPPVPRVISSLRRILFRCCGRSLLSGSPRASPGRPRRRAAGDPMGAAPSHPGPATDPTRAARESRAFSSASMRVVRWPPLSRLRTTEASDLPCPPRRPINPQRPWDRHLTAQEHKAASVGHLPSATHKMRSPGRGSVACGKALAK